MRRGFCAFRRAEWGRRPDPILHAAARGCTGLLVLLLAVACGPGPTSTLPPATVTVPIDMPVVVSLAGFFDDQTLALLDEQIAAFEATNPDVRVELVGADRDPDERRRKLTEHLAGGDTSRDIYLLNTHWLAGFAAEGWLLPLDAYLPAAGLEGGTFLPAAAEANRVQGKVLALPWTADAGLLYYRRDLLAGAGLEPPATWPELEQVAIAAREASGVAHGYVWQGAAADALTCNTLEVVWARGGDVVDGTGQVVFDSSATRAALDQMAAWIEQGVSPPEVTTYQENGALADFQAGNAILMRNWTYAWDRLNEPGSPVAGQVGIAPLPVACLGGQSLGLAAHSLYPEHAFRFMAFLVAHEQQAQLARRGIQPPARQSVYRDEALLAASPVLADLYPALLAARPRPQVPAYPALSEAIYAEVHRLLLGEQDAATTAAAVQAAIEQVLP